jgi:tetratricopeptide (TPR) repeat protein
MTMNTRHLAIGFLLVAFVSSVVHAAPATCEASGKIVDENGEGIAGAKIVFAPTGNPATQYDGKTNKKGRYYVPGMFNPSSEGKWNVKIEAEGYLPISMEIETRTVNGVLIDEATTKLNPRSEIPAVLIKAMGNARIDFVMSPADKVAEAAEALAAQKAAEAAAEGGGGATQARDPYEAALETVSAGDLAGSVELFEKAVADEPDSAERQESFAKVLYQLERYDEAEPYALRALELEPSNVEMYMVLYSVYVGMGQLDQAAEALHKAEEVAPGDPRIMQQLAYVANESGDTEGAITAYEGLVEADPGNTENWLTLAGLYADAGATDKSTEAYGKVVELDPEGAPQVFFNLGALLMNKPDRTDEDSSRAIEAFRQAIELDPEYREAHKQLAFALLGAGDRAGAKSELEAYVALAPDAADSAQMKALIQGLQ